MKFISNEQCFKSSGFKRHAASDLMKLENGAVARPLGRAQQARPDISRRSFLKAVAPLALGLAVSARGQIPIERGRFNEDSLPLAREELLKQVNADRARAGLRQLQLDDLASRVANEHARDMVQGDFLSHWGRDGRKPYHRYSFAGGTDAVQENVSSAQNIQSVTPTNVNRDLFEMHLSMISEVPPHDGHRKTILSPPLTHVGFGIALEGTISGSTSFTCRDT